MPTKFIAVDGCILNHKAGSTITGGVFTITSVPSIKVKGETKGAHKEQIQYTFSGGTFPGLVPGSVATLAPQVILASSLKCKVEDVFVMRVEDFGIMTAQGTVPPPTGGVAPATGSVEIADAGQIKVKSN